VEIYEYQPQVLHAKLCIVDKKVFAGSSNLDVRSFKMNYELMLRFTDLTPGDMRLAAYLKMNLSSKEIAPLLNISVRGVENKRYRLRKKLGLHNDANLVDYLLSITH